MNFSKLILSLSFVAISLLSIDIFGSETKHQVIAAIQNFGVPHVVEYIAQENNSEQLNARVYPRGHKFQHTIITQQLNGNTTQIINKKYRHPVVGFDNKYFIVGKEITGREQETYTARKEVCCCGCEPLDLADEFNPYCFACCGTCVLVQESCGCKRTVAYQVPTLDEMQR